MKPVAALIATVWLAASASTVMAALEVGAKAPIFTAPASLAGKPFEYSLADALKKGPVVLYFYPAAFTKGCSVEARKFAEAIDDYAALGATVIGVSSDSIDVLNKFSVSDCQGKFPVASDATRTIMQSYDAVLMLKPQWADRVSYVISPEGTILYSYSALSPDKHVSNTLAAVRKWKAAQK